MKKNLYLIILGAFLFSGATAQKVDSGIEANELVKVTPQEKIFVHYNSTLLFPGEYLLYKVYNRNARNLEPSRISKIAYVELMGEQGNSVFKQKVQLEEGIGHADFFIPTSVPSGNYKLLSYTNWMKNSGEYFEGDLTIINPYQGRQVHLLENASEKDVFHSGSPQEVNRNPSLHLELNKREFQLRERVLLKTKGKEAGLQDLSVSVRKLNEVELPENISAEDFSRLKEKEISPEKSVFLPELRGQLFRGKISFLDSANMGSLANKKVLISIPSEGLFPQMAITDEKGFFFFDLDKTSVGERAALEVHGKDREQYSIELLKEEYIDPLDLNFREFRLSPEMKDMIIRRSVHNQIENSYFAAKPDTLVTRPEKETFYNGILQSYSLDDYTRFKTIPETFVEIIKSAWIKKAPDGKSTIAVRGVLGNLDLNLLPLVTIDGVVVQDHEDLINLNPQKVKSLSIIRTKLYVGPDVFQGAVLVETFDGDYFDNYSRSYTRKVELALPEIKKKYFRQNYDEQSRLSRIPDYRYQLLWQPSLNPGREDELEFFTSDVPGDYEIVVEGFSKSGEPISVREIFSVRESN